MDTQTGRHGMVVEFLIALSIVDDPSFFSSDIVPQGIAYMINTATGVCQMRNMTQGLVLFPSNPGESDSVRQQTYTRFFLLNGTTSI